MTTRAIKMNMMIGIRDAIIMMVKGMVTGPKRKYQKIT